MSKQIYEVRNWVVGDQTLRVRVQTAPGALEGEPIFAQYLAAMAGDADYTEYAGEEVASDIFRAPFNVDGMPETEELEELTADELDALNSYAGAILTYDGAGFVYLTMLSTSVDVDRAMAEANAREEESAEDA